MTPTRKTAIGLGITATIMGGVDASVMREQPLERVETIAEERVEARQVGNVVETTLPWKDAQAIKVKYDMGEPSLKERVVDKRNVEVRFGKKKDNELEYGLLLHEPPDTNTFCYEIENAEDYNWYKQEPLWQEQGLKAPTEQCTATDCDTDGDGEMDVHRPEHVVNSQAVYHKEKKDHIIGEENYETGKAFHRYRPQAVDNEGNTVWGDSNYENGRVCDTFDAKWLNSASYPVNI